MSPQKMKVRNRHNVKGLCCEGAGAIAAVITCLSSGNLTNLFEGFYQLSLT